MIVKILSIFSNRELASIIWFIIFFLLIVITQKNIRKSINELVLAFFDKKIVSVVLFSLIYVIGVLYILKIIGYLESSMIKTSIYWFVFTALGMLYHYVKRKEGKNYFKDLLLQNFKFALLIEYLVNIYQFSFWLEFIFLPIILILSIISAISESKSQLESLKNLISIIFILLAIGLLILSIIDISRSVSDFTNLKVLKEFLLPIILSICFILNAFIFALYMEYDSLFTNYKIYIDNKKFRRYARFRTLIKFRFQLSKIKSLQPITRREFYHGVSKTEIKEVLS